MARTLRQLASRAYTLFHPSGADEDMYLVWVEDGYRRFVHDCGFVYTATEELALVAEQYEYDLPDDFRALKPKGVYLYYPPRTIAAWSALAPGHLRSLQNVTITTTAVHALAIGMEVTIDGVTEHTTAFGCDGDFTIETVPSTTSFTYADARDDAQGGGGFVRLTDRDEVYLAWADERDIITAGYTWTSSDPTEYYLPDGSHIHLVNDVPDGTYPTCMLRYDAEAPSDLADSTALPIPSWCESGIIGYARWQVRLQVVHDPQALAVQAQFPFEPMGYGGPEYADLVAQWNQDVNQKNQLGSRNAEPEDSGATLGEQLDNAQHRAMGYE